MPSRPTLFFVIVISIILLLSLKALYIPFKINYFKACKTFLLRKRPEAYCISALRKTELPAEEEDSKDAEETEIKTQLTRNPSVDQVVLKRI